MNLLEKQIKFSYEIANAFIHGLDEDGIKGAEELLESAIILIPHMSIKHREQLIFISEVISKFQKNNNWLGLADYFNHELPQLLEEVMHELSIKMDSDHNE